MHSGLWCVSNRALNVDKTVKTNEYGISISQHLFIVYFILYIKKHGYINTLHDYYAL